MILKVNVQPNSKENKVVEFRDNILKVKIKAPQIEGKANKALIDFLSEEFNVAKSCIIIKSGIFAKTKIVEIIK